MTAMELGAANLVKHVHLSTASIALPNLSAFTQASPCTVQRPTQISQAHTRSPMPVPRNAVRGQRPFFRRGGPVMDSIKRSGVHIYSDLS